MIVALAWLALAAGRGQAQEPSATDPIARLGEIVAQMKQALDAKQPTKAREVAEAGWPEVAQLTSQSLTDADCRVLLRAFARHAVDARAAAIARDAARHYLEHAPEPAADDRDGTLQRARVHVTLAIALTDLVDYPAALAAQENALAEFSRVLETGDREVLRARGNIAGLKARMGDLHGALAEFEAVVAEQRRTLPADDLDLCLSESSVAVTKLALGDVFGARELLEPLFEKLLTKLPFEHRHVQTTANNLCSARFGTGDLEGAEALAVRVLEARQATLPDDHPQLNGARNSLANIKMQLGDYEAARVLVEKSLSSYPAQLPQSHPSLQNARYVLARIQGRIGDYAGARALLERAIEIDAEALPLGHPRRTRGLGDLARLLSKTGEHRQAVELQRRVLRESEAGSPHPRELLIERWTLAGLLDELEQHDAAEEIYAATLDVLPDGVTESDSAVVSARIQRVNMLVSLRRIDAAASALAEVPIGRAESDIFGLGVALLDLRLWIARAQGDTATAQATTRTLAQRVLDSFGTWKHSPREVGVRARKNTDMLARILTVAAEAEDRVIEQEFARLALALSETLRGIEPRTSRLRALARRTDPARARSLEVALRRAVLHIERVVAGGADSTEASRELADAVREKERIERELGDIVRSAGEPALGSDGPVTAARIAAALPQGSVGLTFVVSDRNYVAPDLLDQRIRWSTDICAMLVTRTGEVKLIQLGPKARIEAAVARLRACVLGAARGDRPAGEDLDAVLVELGERLLREPLAACPEGTERLVVSLDELLQLVPIDALRLPGEPDTFLGERFVIEQVMSLADLVVGDASIEVGQAPRLVAFGGIDYDGAIGEVAAEEAVAEASSRGGAPDRFAPLIDSRREVRRIASMFSARFDPDEERGAAMTRFGSEADSASFVTAVAGAQFVHLATHGYFAKETVRSVLDDDAGRLARFEFGNEDRVSGLSPSLLTGLAFAGANLPRDPLGRRSGILTAEELLTVDLSACYLATLSACDTSLGVRRAGQGYASLRSALQGAGARFVLSSLWKVSDEAAMEWMTGFYDRLWSAGQSPHEAFWASKRAAHAAGMPFRDWAGWVLSGR